MHYFVLNFVDSSKIHKNVLNRIRKVIKEIGYFSGIIYEDVISYIVYEKIKGFDCIPGKEQAKDGLRNDLKIYFDKYYGTFVETFK